MKVDVHVVGKMERRDQGAVGKLSLRGERTKFRKLVVPGTGYTFHHFSQAWTSVLTQEGGNPGAKPESNLC